MKIFIAGGTSGIGLAVAIRYLNEGHEVGICGRNTEKVTIAQNFPLLKMYQLDIYQKEELKQAANTFSNGELDIMIISAGSYTNDSLQKLTYQESTDMLRVNIVGTVNALEVAREMMFTKQKGHIAVLASISGLLHYRNMTTYSMTKRALIQIANAYRKALSNFGINITVIAPGYVNTPKLQELNNGNLSKKLFVVDCNYAANQIINAIELKKEQVVFPSKMKWTIQLLSLLPSTLISFIMYKKAKWSEQK